MNKRINLWSGWLLAGVAMEAHALVTNRSVTLSENLYRWSIPRRGTSLALYTVSAVWLAAHIATWGNGAIKPRRKGLVWWILHPMTIKPPPRKGA